MFQRSGPFLFLWSAAILQARITASLSDGSVVILRENVQEECPIREQRRESNAVFGEEELVEVFRAGEGGTGCIRIPSLVYEEQSRTLLAIAECRFWIGDNCLPLVENISELLQTKHILKMIELIEHPKIQKHFKDLLNELNVLGLEDFKALLDAVQYSTPVWTYVYSVIFGSENENLAIKVHSKKSSALDTRLCMKTSPDSGATWSPLTFLPTGQSASPTAVVINGRVIVQYSTKVGSVLQIETSNLGKTWSSPVNISAQLSQKNLSATGSVGPGRGLLTSKGRLIFATHTGVYSSVLIWYSDDGGSTYQLSRTTNGDPFLAQMDESQLVELKNGSILINMRNNQTKARAISRSDDNGAQFQSNIHFDRQLPDPTCQASIISDANRNNIYFSNPASETSRTHMTVRRSLDSANTWPYSYLVNEDYAGYSCLSDLDSPRHIGLLFETQALEYLCFGACRIVFTKVPRNFTDKAN